MSLSLLLSPSSHSEINKTFFKNDNSQHNNSSPMCMNLNYSYLLARSAKYIF